MLGRHGPGDGDVADVRAHRRFRICGRGTFSHGCIVGRRFAARYDVDSLADGRELMCEAPRSKWDCSRIRYLSVPVAGHRIRTLLLQDVHERVIHAAHARPLIHHIVEGVNPYQRIEEYVLWVLQLRRPRFRRPFLQARSCRRLLRIIVLRSGRLILETRSRLGRDAHTDGRAWVDRGVFSGPPQRYLKANRITAVHDVRSPLAVHADGGFRETAVEDKAARQRGRLAAFGEVRVLALGLRYLDVLENLADDGAAVERILVLVGRIVARPVELHAGPHGPLVDHNVLGAIEKTADPADLLDRVIENVADRQHRGNDDLLIRE